MALWNDKRTPPGVLTDTRSGQNGSISGPKGWREQTGPEPTVESSFAQPKAPSWQNRTDREPTIWEKPPKAPGMSGVSKSPSKPGTAPARGKSPTTVTKPKPSAAQEMKRLGMESMPRVTKKDARDAIDAGKQRAALDAGKPPRKKVAVKPPRR